MMTIAPAVTTVKGSTKIVSLAQRQHWRGFAGSRYSQEDILE